MYVDDLPAVWSLVQWNLTGEERIWAAEEQSTASLLWSKDSPEVILRLLLDETGIEHLFESPTGYITEEQGE
jgi:hypothetical protein